MIFEPPALAGRKSATRGGHEQHVGVRERLARRRARAPRRSPPPRSGRRPVRGSATLAATSVTSAPRRAASSASAKPIRPEERLPDVAHGVDRLARAAGGHQHAQAVERARREVGAGQRPARSRRGSRPARPGGPRPTRPSTPARRCRGRRPARRARRSLARFARVAGCSYIWSFIAGATTQRRRAGQRGAGEHVVGQAGGELGQRVGGGRRDREGVRAAHQLQMGDRRVLGLGVARDRRRGRGRARTRRPARARRSRPRRWRGPRSRRLPGVCTTRTA